MVAGRAVRKLLLEDIKWYPGYFILTERSARLSPKVIWKIEMNLMNLWNIEIVPQNIGSAN